MADIQLRFHNDMLVLSSPIRTQLDRIGVDTVRDNELTMLIEPEILDEAYALELAAGAQCIVANTTNMTPAKLAHSRMTATADDIARAALAATRGGEEYGQSPQHVLVEISPCGLPLDASSKGSLNENRDQYSRAVETFTPLNPLFDAFFLNGFTSCSDLKCALMGLRRITDKPVFASVRLGGQVSSDGEDNGNFGDRVAGDDSGIGGAVADDAGTEGALDLSLGGRRRESLADAVSVMAEYGAQVVGFETTASPDVAASLVRESLAVSVLPVLAQLYVKKIDPEQAAPTTENPYYEPDTMMDAADILRAAGAQFLRATGNASPSYTGALVGATLGDSVERPGIMPTSVAMPMEQADLDDLAERLRARINDALSSN